MAEIRQYIVNFFVNLCNKMKQASGDTIEWVAILCLHGATLPGMLSLMLGITDNTPPIDLVLLLWAALGLMFLRAIVHKKIAHQITISLGFMAQAMMMALIFFR